MISPLDHMRSGLQPPEVSELGHPGSGNADGSRDLAVSVRPDRLTISEEAREKALAMTGKKTEKSNPAEKAGKGETGPPGQLTDEEKEVVEELKKRDREVRAHEMAHMAASGGHAVGGPSYEYQRGPDGVQYAVGGEVQIDTSPVKGDPRATIAKAQAVKAAALAPAEPSGADRAVAAAAAMMEAEAQAQLNEQMKTGDGVDGKGTDKQGGGQGIADKQGDSEKTHRHEPLDFLA